MSNDSTENHIRYKKSKEPEEAGMQRADISHSF